MRYNENLEQQQNRFQLEVRGLKEQLNEAEANRDMLEREVQSAREKLEAVRLENLTDNEETISELSRRHERDKIILLEDKKKLTIELAALTENVNRYCTKKIDFN